MSIGESMRRSRGGARQRSRYLLIAPPRYRLSLLGVLALFAPPALVAQQPLSLEDAQRLAREHSPAYHQTLNDVGAAAARERASWFAFAPTLSGSLGFGGSNSRTLTGEDDFGQPRSLEEPLEFESSSSTQALGLSLTLFDGFRRLNELRAERAASRGVDARVRLEAIRLDAEVARRYYAMLAAERRVGLEETLLASARERLAAAEELLRVARPHEDVLGARVDLARQEQALRRARGEAEKARLALREAVGVDGDPSTSLGAGSAYQLTSGFPEPLDPAALDGDALVARALGSSPQLDEAEFAALAAERRAGAASSTRWPSVEASLGWSRGMWLRSYDALFELNPQNRSLSFGLSARMPLFDQLRGSAQAAQASAAAADADEELRAQRLAVEREVRSALIDLRDAHAGLELAGLAASLSRERVELAQRRYAVGALDFPTLQMIIEQASAAERQAADAELAYAAALVALEEKVGSSVSP